jgi:hypothetical protein
MNVYHPVGRRDFYVQEEDGSKCYLGSVHDSDFDLAGEEPESRKMNYFNCPLY